LSTTSLISFTSASERANLTAEAFSTVLDAFLLPSLSGLVRMVHERTTHEEPGSGMTCGPSADTQAMES
jgi:hypothetical protein